MQVKYPFNDFNITSLIYTVYKNSNVFKYNCFFVLFFDYLDLEFFN